MRRARADGARPGARRGGRGGSALPHCGGILKSATISFGQALVPEDLLRAQMAASECDLLLAVGSTLSGLSDRRRRAGRQARRRAGRDPQRRADGDGRHRRRRAARLDQRDPAAAGRVGRIERPLQRRASEEKGMTRETMSRREFVSGVGAGAVMLAAVHVGRRRHDAGRDAARARSVRRPDAAATRRLPAARRRLEAGRRARVRLGVHLRPLHADLLRRRRPLLRGLEPPRRARRADAAHQGRRAGDRQHLPLSDRRREDGGDHRSRQQRPPDPRHGRRLVRAGVDRVRHAVLHRRRPRPPPRRVAAGDEAALHPGAQHIHGQVLPTGGRAVRAQDGAAAPSADPRRRRRAQAAAADRRPARRHLELLRRSRRRRR